MSDKRPMKKQLKRTMWFLLCYALIALLISSLLIVYTTVPQWLNMIVIIVLAGAMYLPFLWICAIIDKKNAEKHKDDEDPFGE